MTRWQQWMRTEGVRPRLSDVGGFVMVSSGKPSSRCRRAVAAPGMHDLDPWRRLYAFPLRIHELDR